MCVNNTHQWWQEKTKKIRGLYIKQRLEELEEQNLGRSIEAAKKGELGGAEKLQKNNLKNAVVFAVHNLKQEI